MADLTAACAAFIEDIGAEDGLLSIFVPHATAGLVVLEVGAGSGDDLMDALDRLLPREDRLYRHRHGSPGHGALDPNADNATRSVQLGFLAG